MEASKWKEEKNRILDLLKVNSDRLSWIVLKLIANLRLICKP